MIKFFDNTTLLLFLAVIPVVLILLYVYYQDKNKEPPSLLIKLFIGGIVSCGLVLLVSSILEKISPLFSPNSTKNFFGILFYAFISVALVEEICKWIFVYLFGYRSKEFDEVYDGLLYAVFVSLGFAFIENILYVIINNSFYTAFVRGLCAVPSHACDAILMGYHISIAKEYRIHNKKKKERKHLLLSIIMPALIHGIYDFCLLSGNKLFTFVFLVFITFMYFTSVNKLQQMSMSRKNIADKESNKNKFCPKCGMIKNENHTCEKNIKVNKFEFIE